MKSFKSLFLSEDQLDESVGPWRPEDQVGKKAHGFHRAQWDHHMDQKTQGKHKGFKQLQKGVVYQSNSGTWVGQRNGVKQREYFPSRQQAEHWVNGTMPNKGGISFLSMSGFNSTLILPNVGGSLAKAEYFPATTVFSEDSKL